MAACALLFILFLITTPLGLSSSASSIGASTPSSRRGDSVVAGAGEYRQQHHVLDVKKARPYVLSGPARTLPKFKKRRRREWGPRPFSAMLPKGFVPPSGSSSCHNIFPNSVGFYCGESPNDP